MLLFMSEKKCYEVWLFVMYISFNFNFFFTQGRIVFCDSCFCTLYGYPSSEDMKGLDIRELIPSIEFDTENNCGNLISKVSFTVTANNFWQQLFVIFPCFILFIVNDIFMKSLLILLRKFSMNEGKLLWINFQVFYNICKEKLIEFTFVAETSKPLLKENFCTNHKTRICRMFRVNGLFFGVGID